MLTVLRLLRNEYHFGGYIHAQTILGRIVCCDTPDTLEQHPDSATRDLLRHHPFRLERLRTP